MSGPDECVSTLVELGLSLLEAKVYLALVKAKNQTAHTISVSSRVSRPDVYRVLSRLEEARLIERAIGKPNKFDAIPIETCVSILMQQRISKTAELEKKTLELIQSFRQRESEEELVEKSQFILVPRKEALYARGEKMIANAQECICILGPARRVLFWLLNFTPVFKEALARKVVCKIIMPKFDTEKNVYETLSVFNYRDFRVRFVAEEPKTTLGIYDRKEILIGTSAVDSIGLFPALWSNNKSLVDLCEDYFDWQWRARAS